MLQQAVNIAFTTVHICSMGHALHSKRWVSLTPCPHLGALQLKVVQVAVNAGPHT